MCVCVRARARVCEMPSPPSLQEHRTEIDARAGTFQAFEQFGQQLLARGHYASAEVQQKLEALEQERTHLEKAWVQRRMMLDQCLELQVGRAGPGRGAGPPSRQR